MRLRWFQCKESCQSLPFKQPSFSQSFPDLIDKGAAFICAAWRIKEAAVPSDWTAGSANRSHAAPPGKKRARSASSMSIGLADKGGRSISGVLLCPDQRLILQRPRTTDLRRNGSKCPSPNRFQRRILVKAAVLCLFPKGRGSLIYRPALAVGLYWDDTLSNIVGEGNRVKAAIW